VDYYKWYNSYMKEDEFTKLFKYIEEFRSEVNRRFDETAPKSSMDHLINTLDGFLRRLDDNEIEQAARDLQFNRLVEWAREVSKKTGVPMPDL
jgi:hypothetical protein